MKRPPLTGDSPPLVPNALVPSGRPKDGWLVATAKTPVDVNTCPPDVYVPILVVSDEPDRYCAVDV